MKKVFSPLFILLFVTVPQLLALGYALLPGVSEISSLRYPITVLWIFNLLFMGYTYVKRKKDETDLKVFILMSAIYTLFIAYTVLFGGGISYAKGLASPRLVFVAVCMLSALYGIMGMVYKTTPPNKAYDLSKYVAGIIFVPFLWFLGMNLVIGMNSNTIAIILIIACVFAVLFMMIKVLFIWKLNKVFFSFDTPPTKKYYILTLIVALCMPLGGLAINQAFSGLGNDSNSTGLFGDFSHPLYYFIAIANGILLLLPPLEDKRFRLLLFYLKSVGYAYILYFFIIFLPSIPLGLIGIIFYGLGILVLTPLLVTILQGFHLTKEWLALSIAWKHWHLAVIFLVGMMTLPLCVTAAFLGDKENFSIATQYLEQNDFNHTRAVNLTRLRRTLKNAKGGLQLRSGNLGFSSGNTPILSAFYTKLILDGKLVSQDNILALENLFFDAGHNMTETNLSNPNLVTSYIQLTDAISETRFDEKNSVYKSWVNLKLKNPSPSGNGEYKTTFKLPEGAYISDYYLNVAGTRKEGMLTDRRAALFIYRKIVNTRRDPGLLHYIGRNTLELRVFPFGPNEVRETGFEIIHSQKFDFSLDHKVLSLGGDKEQKQVQVNGGVLLTAAEKAKLQPVVRTPKYYFIIDNSKNSSVAWHIDQVQAYAKANKITEADVIFASYQLKQHTLADIASVKYKTESGYNLNAAVNMILRTESKNTYPVIIAVSDNMPGAVYPKNAYPLSKKFPESPCYYALNHNLTLTPYSYDDNKAGNAVDTPIVKPILDFHGVYVLNNNQSELVLTVTQASEFISTNNQYTDAILLDTIRQKELLAGKADSLDLVRASFRTRILTPQTAFIVVETPQQEKELLDLQERILNKDESTPTVTLDEPSFITCLILLLIMACILNRKKIKSMLIAEVSRYTP